MKIAFIDSGVGGLVFAIDMIKSVSNNLLNNYEFLHVGDAENVPYGLKTPDVLQKITIELIQKSIDLGAQKVIVACNTACTILNSNILQNFKNQKIDVFSIKDYTVSHIFDKLQNKNANLLILATKRTVQSHMYKNAINELFAQNNKSINIIQHYPIEWEEAVEMDFKGFNAKALIHSELAHIQNLMGDERFSQITHVGLFCTHYPIIKNETFEFMKNNSKVNDLENIFSQGSTMSTLLENTSLKSSSFNNGVIEIKSTDKSGKYFALPKCIEEYSKLNNINIVRL